MQRCVLVVAVASAGCGDNLAATASVRILTEGTEGIGGRPVAGARIAVVDGPVPVAIYTTDAEGQAELTVTAALGATVIALRDDGDIDFLHVVSGVTAGQHLELGSRPEPAPTSVAGVLTIAYAAYPGGPWDYASDYYPCSNGGTTLDPGVVEIETFTGCPAEARTLHLIASDPSTLAPVGFAPIADVAARPGMLVAGPWEPGTTYSVTVTGGPAITDEVYTELAFPGAWRLVILDGVIAGGTGTTTRLDATIPGPARAVTRITTTGSFGQFVATPEVTPPALAIDGSALLPFIIDVGYDAAARAITWREVVPGTAAVAVTAGLSYYDPITRAQFEWTVYAPASGGRLEIPELPDELTAYDLDPAGVDVVVRDLWLVAVDGADYGEVIRELDLDRDLLGGDGYRPADRSLASGGEL